MIAVFHKAWREQREQQVILPLTTILAVMFFGQAMVGAVTSDQQPNMQVTLSFCIDLLHLRCGLSLLLLAYTSGTLVQDESKAFCW